MKDFTLKDYKRNESRNHHTENALQLVKMFGTDDEIKSVKRIAQLHKKQGFLTYEQVRERYELSNKYYSYLKNLPQ